MSASMVLFFFLLLLVSSPLPQPSCTGGFGLGGAAPSRPWWQQPPGTCARAMPKRMASLAPGTWVHLDLINARDKKGDREKEASGGWSSHGQREVLDFAAKLTDSTRRSWDPEDKKLDLVIPWRGARPSCEKEQGVPWWGPCGGSWRQVGHNGGRPEAVGSGEEHHLQAPSGSGLGGSGSATGDMGEENERLRCENARLTRRRTSVANYSGESSEAVPPPPPLPLAILEQGRNINPAALLAAVSAASPGRTKVAGWRKKKGQLRRLHG
ncbi:hypothetical protein ACP70R_001496 [Stipagrostis hirtigluma subsp. patula]